MSTTGSDSEVTIEIAASMLSVSRTHLDQLLVIGAIPYSGAGDERRVRVGDLHAYRKRRDLAQAGMREMAAIVNESPHGTTR